MIMKAVYNGTPFAVGKILPRAGLELGTARSVGPAFNPLSYRGFMCQQAPWSYVINKLLGNNYSLFISKSCTCMFI